MPMLLVDEQETLPKHFEIDISHNYKSLSFSKFSLK